MVTPVNSDKSVNPRIDTPSQSAQRMSKNPDRQASDSTQARPGQKADAGVDVESARQRYQIENHLSSAPSRISTPEQAGDLLGRVLQQFTADPGRSLQAQSPSSPAALSNLLERAPD
jgi:hypothetical protein